MKLRNLLLNITVGAISLSYGFLDWLGYRRMLIAHPNDWTLYLHGGIDAPLQYRMGTWVIVGWASRFHMSEWLTLTLIDLACLALTLYCLVYLLQKQIAFLRSSLSVQLLSIAGLFLLVEYYLPWGHWFQYSGTLPSVLFVCLSTLLAYRTAVQNRIVASLLLIALSIMQGFVRADVSVVFHGGFLLAAFFPFSKNVPLGRIWQAVTSGLAALFAGLVQLYLMLVRFRAARYGPEGVLQVTTNLHPLQWLTALLALIPFWAILSLVIARKIRLDCVSGALLLSSLLYLGLWFMVGQLEEVRIFLPFAIALLPSTSAVCGAKLSAISGINAGSEATPA